MVLEIVKEFIGMYPAYAGVILIVAKILGAALLLPGTPLTLLAGALFGITIGVCISLVGNILGAMLAFFIARFFFRDYILNVVLPRYPKIAKYENRFFTHGLRTVMLLRLIPVFPFNILNYLLGVTRVSNRDYIIGTSLGIIPGTIAYVYFGEAIAMLSVVNIICALLAIIGLVYIGKRYERHH